MGLLARGSQLFTADWRDNIPADCLTFCCEAVDDFTETRKVAVVLVAAAVQLAFLTALTLVARGIVFLLTEQNTTDHCYHRIN